MPKTILDIGFNNFVERNGKDFLVQTEVIEGDTTKIKTTIMKDGSVIDTFVSVFGNPQDGVNQARSFISKQHEEALLRLQEGQYD